MHRLLVGVAALGLVACSKSGATLDIAITTGQEKGAFDADPAVVEVKITATPLSGDGGPLTATTKPGGTFDLGNVDASMPYTYEVEGTSAAGEVVVEGRSLPIASGAIEGDTFEVFCQRVDVWARPPNGLAATHVGGVAAIAAERFLFLSGGSKVLNADGTSASGTQGDFYDMLALGGATSNDALPFAPETAVGLSDSALLIDAQTATWLSFEDGSTSDATAPSGLDSFGDVAGGRPYLAPDGRTFILGASREGTRTGALLSIATDGTLGALELAHPRAGAAAGWVDGIGLVVAGGASDAPGVEILASGASTFRDHPFPSDETIGAAIGSTAGGVYLVGGVDRRGASAPTRKIDPGCSSACVAEEIADLALPAGLIGTQIFVLEHERLLVAGTEAKDGSARAFQLDLSAKKVSELELRVPRTGASFVAAPNGTLAVLGGLRADGSPAVDVETLFPR